MAESFTTRLTQRLQIEQKKNDHGGVYAFAQRTLAYHSNRIEGSTLTEKQTASLFDTGTLTSEDALIRAKDGEEMTGHFLMFNEMLKTYQEPLSHELIKRYHYKLKSGVFEDIANGYPIGEYKNRRNIVSDITTALPEDVHARMTTLLDEYNAADKHDLHGLAKFHADYEAIHPFQDGNGRTGRLILFKECLKNDIIPFVVNDSRKAEYYHALNTAQTKPAGRGFPATGQRIANATAATTRLLPPNIGSPNRGRKHTKTTQNVGELRLFSSRCDANTSHSTAPTPKTMRSNRTGRTKMNDPTQFEQVDET